MGEPMVILVTGASGGIGRACAAYLGGRGHRVYGTSRRAPAEPGEAFRMVQMDVADGSSVVKAVEEIVRREGRIDAVFNNAGLHVVGPVEDLPMEDVEACFQTNCLGAIRVCKTVLPFMRAQGGGRIINMSSAAGVIALPFQSAYSGSKFALEAMSEALRTEVRRFGVKVSIIEPGDIRHQDCHTKATASKAYEPAFSNAMRQAWADEEKGYPPERIGPLVERILASRDPRFRYAFGPSFQAVAMTLKRRILPDRLGTWAIAAYYKA